MHLPRAAVALPDNAAGSVGVGPSPAPRPQQPPFDLLSSARIPHTESPSVNPPPAVAGRPAPGLPCAVASGLGRRCGPRHRLERPAVDHVLKRGERPRWPGLDGRSDGIAGCEAEEGAEVDDNRLRPDRPGLMFEPLASRPRNRATVARSPGRRPPAMTSRRRRHGSEAIRSATFRSSREEPWALSPNL
jgi:hypothetical protein